MSTHRGSLLTVLVAAALLATSCAESPTRPSHDGARLSSSSPERKDAAGLPAGIAELGAAGSMEDGAWTLSVTELKPLSAGVAAEVPKGWAAYSAEVKVANRQSQIATPPQTELTVRYGALGREAMSLVEDDGGAVVVPSGDTRIRPHGSVTSDVRFAFPASARGQRVTVTAEATAAGLAEPERLFFEGAVPGASTASSEEQVPAGEGRSPDVTPLGEWHAGTIRLSPVSVTKDGPSRIARVELSVANGSSDPLPGFGVTLRILTGADLRLADTIHPVYGYHDAAIAPERIATQTVDFRVPSSAVGGPLTIEAVNLGGSRVVFEGRLG
ncbi:hypothetical protein OG800_49670 (plasmid) [Streptomyces sp. NBC_00445]|uniref:hypothetical protein n=1 Tax=Streptomyces sp. NBC_00445 TaxID=2975745 RepID=UPI002E1D8E8C